MIKWFLPRILDLLASGNELASVGSEVVLNRLADSGFPDAWPDPAVEFMTRYATTLMRAYVASPEVFRTDAFDLDQLLCMFGLGGVNLRPALAWLEALPTTPLPRCLARS